MIKRAIIDIGTNTAHLLIGEITSGQLQVLTKKRHYTFLGEGGLEEINKAAIQRLDIALQDFVKILQEYNCSKVHVIATEGLRSASNSTDITDVIEKTYKWPYSIITGDQEAHYIYHGASQASPLSSLPHLVMDIGGGSVEFILHDGNNITYQESHPIGISRLYEKYHHTDPITEADIHHMYDDLDQELQELWALVSTMSHSPLLVGCAGTFEVLLSPEDLHDLSLGSREVSTSHLMSLLASVIHKSIDERKIVPDLPSERANYIVVALLLMNYMVKKLSATTIRVSKYALKEGAIMDDSLYR